MLEFCNDVSAENTEWNDGTHMVYLERERRTDRNPISILRVINRKLRAILDRLVPARTVTCRERPSDPWFDQECRLAKRRVRQLERVPRSAEVNSSAVAEWTAERRAYRALLRRKREAFWTSSVE